MSSNRGLTAYAPTRPLGWIKFVELARRPTRVHGIA